MAYYNPKTKKDFKELLLKLRTLIDTLSGIPGYDPDIWAELNRDFEDLVDRAYSQGVI